jgi:predicted permease
VPTELKFAIFQLVIILPFLAGSFLKNRLKNPERASKSLITVNLTLIEPPIVIWSIWGLALNAEMIFLPVSGVFLAVSGFIIGKLAVHKMRLTGTDAKTIVISSSLANHGFTMGGFLCYLFAGEQGLALSAIFLIYFIPFTFLFIFSYANVKDRNQVFQWAFVKDLLFSFRNMPLYAVFIAIFIRLTGINRPDVYFPLDILLILSIALYYFTLGINFKFNDLHFFKKEHVFLAAQKFILLPAITFFILEFIAISDAIKMIIKLQSFMPAAIYSVITAILFDLNARQASGLFVVNSILFIFLVLPLLFFARNFLL